ncbi:MAG: M20/M25/M40 family metallo-hydrolase [Bryobacteraceae bacterium]
MLACLPVLLLVPSAALAQEKVDLRIVSRIRHEAFENSKVMEHMFYLTDANGPRLSNSPGFKRAGEWAVKTLKGYGLDNAHPEKFEFGQGWENTRFAVNVVEPNYQPLIGVPGAWTAGTDGPMTAEVVMATIKAEEDFEKWKGKLAGKIVLLNPEREISPLDKPLNHRYTDAELDSLALAPNPGERTGASANRAGRPPMNIQQLRAFRKKLAAFFVEEKVAAVVYAGFNGDGGTVFTMMAGSRDVKDPVPPPMITLTPEHYNRIVRLMDKKIPVKLEIEAKNTFFKDDVNSFNVIGDIPGKTDEIVMMGGHLDSWHGAQGATDNAAGVAVMMEVARILNSLGVKMKRTVRIGLWGGEEQGLLGSKAYVKEHFADPATMKTTTEHAKLSAYYNLDNGSGKIRGVYLQGNDMMRPIFEAWLDPFKDLGARTVSIRNTGGTDHLSYDAVGLPGFQFIQDELEYSTRTHHSNMDNYDRIQKGDLMEAAAIIASFVYNTAMADEMMPRKPLPKARPAEGAGAPTGGSF